METETMPDISRRDNTISDDTITVRPLDWSLEAEREGLYRLRRLVLRPGRPPEASVYPGDNAPHTVHLGAFLEGKIVGIATLLDDGDSWRLRGMAVEPEMQKYGIGRQIIRYAQQMAIDRHRSLWCQARESAVGFYEKLGWTIDGEQFDIADVGAHYVMRWTPA